MAQVPNADGFKNQLEAKAVTYHDIATKLLHDKFLLTALELHTELVECGREVKQLKDFFSNPGNFEVPWQDTSSRISRSESQVTLDSLDLTRYSEDGAGTDERIAVLEFELRKAKETINALRNNLTMATESETSTPDKGCMRHLNTDVIKPHEQRALNFLINEYLLLNSYKLTSITFADENQHQDFDDWDDVGLNISKPPELITLYRECFKQTSLDRLSTGTQTDFDLSSYENLRQKIIEQEEDLKKLEAKYKNLESEYNELKSIKETELLPSQNKSTPNSKDSLGSESPSERFEIIDKNMTSFKKRDSIITLEDNISNSSLNVNDWTNLTITTHDSVNNESATKGIDSPKEKASKLINIDISQEPFIKEVFSLCYVNIPQKVDNEILDDILNYSVTNENLVHTLSLSLLKIIPNIILNKREDAIPLLIGAVQLNSNSGERDKLLQQLFNLKKKPSDTERIMILTGLVGIAKYSGENLVENEILPQCWEQLTDKHVEKRLLVAEACTALIPYVSSQIRNSLILSMLQQLLEDREDLVREAVIRALSLVMVLCEDSDKYLQCEEITLNILNDPSASIVNLAIQILIPVLGKWALSIGRLKSHLIKYLLHKLSDYSRDFESSKQSNKILCIIEVLEALMPFVLISVVLHEQVVSNIEKDMTIDLRADLNKLCSNLTNPSVFCKWDHNVGMVLYEFDKYIASNPTSSWDEMAWILDMMIPDLLNSLNHIDITYQSIIQNFINLFSHICIFFGKSFTKFKIQPIFQVQVNSLEQIFSNFNQYSPSLNIIPVYLVSVLSYCDRDELSIVLKKFLCTLPLCGTPLDCLEVSVKGLCENGLQTLVVSSLWEGVVHQSPLVRAVTADLFSAIVGFCDKNLLSLKVTPGLVTLASDNDTLVKTAAIPALGTLVTNCNEKEIHDKVYVQFQNYLTDPSVKENHTVIRQLIVTLGSIVNHCSAQFRQEVILPQLSLISTYLSQMSNQTRKIDLANALIEAFTTVVYSPFNKQDITSLIIPGLRCLETAVTENQSLTCHRDIIGSMIRECDDHAESSTHAQPEHSNKLQNVNQGVEEMKQRMSKIFTKPAGSKPNTLPNLQSIFKKK
ncbi:RAB11-binding protein RELCH homolog [Tribolium castaneum]|uniref:LisH domain and HEAT repeat-containing protein KIAA1468-like Protein n=1 Tax=Tribolium castaneum TaxID=7070 RepID=D6WGG1_TRICA|nr:PREDICTED: lisH domain and HEAT repeat-containing protein KIAA1468 homolog [Tribolium castaneum]EFA00181.1 LisH domain and HEAT repeat-containing protein KIAA1468-like Protein [Tribolium castaneum]|eukprot:XP_008190864.1 PREDICTED: lisH domain and HEAT repeat-containing protein KIAA1468 homolog [Tribolium castaneum]